MLLADRGYDAGWIRTLAALAANCDSLMLATSELSSSSLGPPIKVRPNPLLLGAAAGKRRGFGRDRYFGAIDIIAD